MAIKLKGEFFMVNVMYKTLESLKNRLDKGNELAIHLFDGFSFIAKFNFNVPASLEDINYFLSENNINIPNEYKDFLLLHNGAELFKGKYEAPIKLYSLEEIVANNTRQIPSGFFPIGYYPDTGFIMINSNNLKYNNSNYMWILDTDPINLKCDFKTWFNRIIVAQGMNYWEWNSQIVPLDKS